jgi:hypothetical protein
MSVVSNDIMPNWFNACVTPVTSNCYVSDTSTNSNSNCHVCGTSVVSNGIVSNSFNACGTLVTSNCCYVCSTCNLLTSASIAANSQTYSSALITNRPLQSPHGEALRLIQRAAAGWVDAEDAYEWRSDLLRTFQAWQEHAKEVSQRHFWRVFNTLEAPSSAPGKSAVLQRFYVELEAAHEIAEARYDVTPWNSYRDLSARSIRSILGGVVGQLEELDATQCVATILSHLNDALKRGVLVLADRRRKSTNLEAARSAPSTHDWVLDFSIHTGNSPPALADRRPAVSRAPVSLKAPRTVDYGTISGRENSADLRNEICTRNTRVRLNRRSQGHARVVGGVRPAGRWGHRTHCSLAEYA